MIKKFAKLSQLEYGVDFELQESTNFYDTLKQKQTEKFINYEKDLTEYYQYKSNNLGVDSVYFFFDGDKVFEFYFAGDKITNKEAAKKDKYLRQIMD
ncbi:hypothetical protein MXZ33_08860 [Streptococcus uberis]|nr:hypothetical protein [Streptococcus uberis]MCK1200848.1 hypothetical protein [Streptococcus uberis]